MASVDGDVDMSPPVPPTRASPPPSLYPNLNPPKRKLRNDLPAGAKDPQPVAVTDSSAPTTETPPQTSNPPVNSLAQATDEALDEVRQLFFKREGIAREYSKALDDATGRLREMGLEYLTDNLTSAIARILQQFARGEPNFSHVNQQQQRTSQSQLTPGQLQNGHAPTYAQVTRSQTVSNASLNLPEKPILPTTPRTDQIRKTDNRIFIRLPQDHPSRAHHVHAVKAALTKNLELEHDSLKTVQKVKSGIALVPTNEKQAEQILTKSQEITATLGGIVEKAEQWHTYIIDHVPRKLHSLDGTRWNVTEDYAREEVQSVTGFTPVKIAWSRKSNENLAPTGTIVASFKQSIRPFRIFCTSSIARKITKSPRPSQCPKCWGFHDARICNQEPKCKQCGTTGHLSCQAAPKCSNCKGPHPADESYCPARPVVRGGIIRPLTQPELKRIRQAGHRAWQLVNPSTHATETPSAPTQC